MRRNAPCAGLPREERIQCQRAAGTLPPPQDPCERAGDVESCRARLAATDACRGEPAASRARCIQEQLPPQVPRCDRATGLEALHCELYREAALACATERGRAGRDCIDAKWATKLLKERFNPLDCPGAQGTLAARCAARERVRAGCASLATQEARRCRAEFLVDHFEPRDCAAPGVERGACRFQLRVLDACRGRTGQALESCFQTAVRERGAGTAVNCSLQNLNAVERSYCASRDGAIDACLARFDAADRYVACVDESIPAGVKAAAAAASLRRLGPVR